MPAIKKIYGTIRNLVPYRVRCRIQPFREAFLIATSRPLVNDVSTFFIVGSQRSGTTLTALVISAHSGVEIADEDRSYGYLQRGFESSDDKLAGFKMPMWTQRFPLVQRRFPGAKFVFMKRDVRRVAASMLSLRFGGKSWIELHGKTEIERTILAITDRARRAYFHCVYLRKIDSGSPVAIAALCAYLKLSLISEYHRAKVSVLELYYEQLVLRPRLAIAAILNFLDLPWEENLMDHSKGRSGTTVGGTDRARTIDERSLTKWQDELSPNDMEQIDAIVTLARAHDEIAYAEYYRPNDNE